MGHNDHRELAGGDIVSSINIFTAVFTRLIGVLLLLVGLWVSLQVIVEAWNLYRAPQHIEPFAKAIEQGSNLDRLLAQALSAQSATSPTEQALGAEELKNIVAGKKQTSTEPPLPPLRLSYFLAWGIAVLLLILIGRLALSAVKTGGELALYDTEVKKFVQALVREVNKPKLGHSSAPSQQPAGLVRAPGMQNHNPP
jgi:hypothetical protein